MGVGGLVSRILVDVADRVGWVWVLVVGAWIEVEEEVDGVGIGVEWVP